jgi:hypothetical protein
MILWVFGAFRAGEYCERKRLTLLRIGLIAQSEKCEQKNTDERSG